MQTTAQVVLGRKPSLSAAPATATATPTTNSSLSIAHKILRIARSFIRGRDLCEESPRKRSPAPSFPSADCALLTRSFPT